MFVRTSIYPINHPILPILHQQSQPYQETPRHQQINQIKSLLRLRKDRLPYLNPLLLLIRQPPLRLTECASEDLPDSRRKSLQRKHGFPVSHRESDPIGVDGNHPRVHLITRSVSHMIYRGAYSRKKRKGGVTYLKLRITAQ